MNEKKKIDPPKCLKCEKVLKWPKWTGQKSLPVELDGKKHICGVSPTDLEDDIEDEGIVTTCPACDAKVKSKNNNYYDNDNCSLIHRCSASETQTEEEDVKFQPANKITKGYPGLKVTKIKLERTDNKWVSDALKKGDMHYGTGEQKTDSKGRGKTVTAGLEIETNMVDPTHLDNAMSDMAVLLRKHNRRELEQ